ncbi:coiled-coil domain-containing protein [Pedobacter panaciterrae]
MKKLFLLSVAILLSVFSANAQSDTSKTSQKKDSISAVTTLNKIDSGRKESLKLSEQLLSEQRALSKLVKSRDSINSTNDIKAKAKLAKIQEKINKSTKELKDAEKQFNKAKHDQDSLLAILKKNVTDLDTQAAKLKKDSTKLKNGVDSLKKDSTSVSNKVKALQATIAAQIDSMEVVAIIKMNDSLKIYKKLNKTRAEADAMIADPLFHAKGFVYDKNRDILKVTKVCIKKVHILAREGIMLEIVVTTDKGIFRNKHSVIDLAHMDSRFDDKLFYEKQEYYHGADKMYVFLDDVISYTPVKSYSELPYSDFDITLTSDDGKDIFYLKESTSINSYVNVSAFTDIKGISGEPNAIAQFTAEAKFITNTRNFRNGATVAGNFISFIGGLSKYDTKFKGTMLINKDSVDRKDLLQRSNYSVGFKLNLLRGLPSPYPKHLINDWQINIGYNFVGSKVSDTSFKDAAKTVIDTTFRTVTMNQWFIEPKFTVSRGRNFALTLGIPFHMVSLKGSAKIKNDQNEYWASPSIDLMYFGKRDTGSRLFFRYHHFINLKNSEQAYSQMQLGYSLSLTSVWDQK